jgi:hypothetical protein
MIGGDDGGKDNDHNSDDDDDADNDDDEVNPRLYLTSCNLEKCLAYY